MAFNMEGLVLTAVPVYQVVRHSVLIISNINSIGLVGPAAIQ